MLWKKLWFFLKEKKIQIEVKRIKKIKKLHGEIKKHIEKKKKKKKT